MRQESTEEPRRFAGQEETAAGVGGQSQGSTQVSRRLDPKPRATALRKRWRGNTTPHPHYRIVLVFQLTMRAKTSTCSPLILYETELLRQ